MYLRLLFSPFLSDSVSLSWAHSLLQVGKFTDKGEISHNLILWVESEQLTSVSESFKFIL